jgi:hypothetical protein
MTTIAINNIDLSWWNACLNKLEMSSAEAFSKFRRNVELKKQQDFYATLPTPAKYVKPLSGVKIRKNYKKQNGI